MQISVTSVERCWTRTRSGLDLCGCRALCPCDATAGGARPGVIVDSIPSALAVNCRRSHSCISRLPLQASALRCQIRPVAYQACVLLAWRLQCLWL